MRVFDRISHVSRTGTFMLCGSHEGAQEGLLLPKPMPEGMQSAFFLLSHQPEGRPKHGSGRREHRRGARRRGTTPFLNMQPCAKYADEHGRYMNAAQLLFCTACADNPAYMKESPADRSVGDSSLLLCNCDCLPSHCPEAITLYWLCLFLRNPKLTCGTFQAVWHFRAGLRLFPVQVAEFGAVAVRVAGRGL